MGSNRGRIWIDPHNMAGRTAWAIGALSVAVATAVACDSSTSPDRADAETNRAVTGAASAAVLPSATSAAPAPPSPTGTPPVPPPSAPPKPQHLTSQAELLALIERPSGEHKKREAFLGRTIKPGAPSHMNHGNPEIARHLVSRRACLDGLEGVVLQTKQQRQICNDQPNMVPIYKGGDAKTAKTCVDIFEFPNRACELPFVWAGATQARQVCRKLGKRLCTQDEWMFACGGDPDGAERTPYAYGQKLDLEACNTNKSMKVHHDGQCDARSAKSAWKTCPTNTEPSGSFLGCRSRFGVFDQHGNVAEAMTRRDADGKTYSQLKGSAFFYVDVHRTLNEKPKKVTYPDHCRHNPRWHVEKMKKAWHVNYHLGFRCCMTVKATTTR